MKKICHASFKSNHNLFLQYVAAGMFFYTLFTLNALYSICISQKESEHTLNECISHSIFCSYYLRFLVTINVVGTRIQIQRYFNITLLKTDNIVSFKLICAKIYEILFRAIVRLLLSIRHRTKLLIAKRGKRYAIISFEQQIIFSVKFS